MAQQPMTASRIEAELAASINSEHRLAHVRLCEALSHAVEAGKLLLRVRENVEQGGWLAWVRANCEFSTRMAQNYIRLAREYQALPAEDAKRVSHSSIRRALHALLSESAHNETEADGSAVHFSSESDQWNTPKPILKRALALLGSIDLDPCSNDARTPTCQQGFTTPSGTTGSRRHGRDACSSTHRTGGRNTSGLADSTRVIGLGTCPRRLPSCPPGRMHDGLRDFAATRGASSTGGF